MGAKDLEKDLLEVIKNHGLKAGDGTSTESKKKKKKKKGDKEVVADLAEGIAKKLAKAVAENKGYGKGTEDDLKKDVRAKIFTRWAGVKEVSFPADITNLSKDEKIVNFFKALVYRHASPEADKVLRALVEGTDSEGGYLVPEELRAEIFRILPDVTVMRNIARVLPMSTDTLLLNSLTARPAAYWTGEYESKATTSAEFGQVPLSPNDLVCLLPVSDQLLADANINLVQFIIELFAEALGLAEDKAFFTGSGTGQPRGINQESINSIAVGGNLSFDDVIDLIDQVPTRVSQSPGTAFVGHRRTKRILRKLKDGNNNYIWRDMGTAPGGGTESRRLPSTLYSYPFYEQNDISQGELYFGDWRFYIIGDRQTVSVRTTTEGGEAWRRNAMEIKAVERVDGRAVILSPFAKITGI